MNVFDWNIVSAIAELVGAGAVVATLIYLSVQIRQNTATVLAGKDHVPWQYKPLAEL